MSPRELGIRIDETISEWMKRNPLWHVYLALITILAIQVLTIFIVLLRTR